MVPVTVTCIIIRIILYRGMREGGGAMYIPDSLSRSLFSVHLSMYLLQKEYGFVRVASDQEHRHEREIIADSLFSLSLFRTHSLGSHSCLCP